MARTVLLDLLDPLARAWLDRLARVVPRVRRDQRGRPVLLVRSGPLGLVARRAPRVQRVRN